MFSIFHFFKSLVDNKSSFRLSQKLEDFPFDDNLISCKNKGIFPDLIIKTNPNPTLFTGGEMVELKDSKSYVVSSFNSSIPTKYKKMEKVITGEKSKISIQLKEAGESVNTLPIRDVFYLVRGGGNTKMKVCLVSGGFFETLPVEDLIGQSFLQVLEESLEKTSKKIWCIKYIKKTLLSVLSSQDSFRKVRNVEGASIKLRFRIMTEVKPQGNILNSKMYPQIEDNTLNFILPSEKEIVNKVQISFGEKQFNKLKTFKLKHHNNGDYLVFQTDL